MPTRAATALALFALAAGPAQAGPGDLYRVTADLVNLRASPTEEATVRDRVEGGTEVIELRRDGGWLGVRVVPTGQEGWIFGDLLERTADSALGGEGRTAGFGTYSQDFDRLLVQVEERLGAGLLSEVVENGDTLRLTPTPAWLRASSQTAQVLAATAIYGMWKNHQDNAPVRVVMLDETGTDYVVIADEGEDGPVLTVADTASGSDG